MRFRSPAAPVALFAGLVVIAAALYLGLDSRHPSSSSSYSGYEPVVKQWLAMSGIRKGVVVTQLKGPFYKIRYQSRNEARCLMVDVSTQYKGSGDYYDTFWWSAGAAGSSPGKKLTDHACDSSPD